MEENNLTQRLRGRAAYLRDNGEVKSPDLMEDAADEIERLQRMNAPKPCTLGDILREIKSRIMQPNAELSGAELAKRPTQTPG